MDLDSLITRNRHRLSVGLATDDEIETLVLDAPDGEPKGQIEGWHLIALRGDSEDGPVTSLRCLGWSGGETWITSEVTGVARDRSVIATRSGSLYQLSEPAEGDVHPRLVMLVGRALHAWGLSDALGLNVFGR